MAASVAGRHTHLNSSGQEILTQRRGTFTLEFKRYAVVPDSIAQEAIKERKAAGKVPVQ